MTDVRADTTAPPDRTAVTGKRRRRRGEQPMVPDAEFQSYYGRPVLKKPTWEARDIAGYFFLGGLAGASSVLAAGAQLTRRPALARAAKTGALAAISGSLVALVHDLGRPERFLNMLRTVKPTSPMSIGTWLLMAYGPAAGAAAVSEWTGIAPRAGRTAALAAGVVGPAVAAYTAPLMANTAVPSWHEGHRELPFVFVGSAATAAGGLGMVTAPVSEAGPARRAAMLGVALEVSAMKRMERGMGLAAEPLHTGRAGRLLKAAEILTVAGAVVGGVLGGRSRTAAVLGGLAGMAGSACTRFGLFHAGVQSAEDPKYTVQPQRERLNDQSRPER
jgi:hypothetical protein